MLSVIDTAPFTPCPAPFNMAAHVLAHAGSAPDRIALQILRPSGGERWSFARLESAVRGTGTGLLRMGLRPGDRVLMRLGNTVDFPLCYLGAIAAGLVPVPTPAQATAPEATRLAAAVDPALIVLGDGVAAPQSPACPTLTTAGLRAFRDLPPCDWDMGDPDRLAYIIFTSGSSGVPRAVMHAHRAIWARQMMWDGWYGLRPQDRLLHAGAFNWTYTLGTGLMDPWAIGATALVPADGLDPAALGLLLKRFDATIFAAAPGVYRKLLNHDPKLSLPRLRHGLSAGEKLPDVIREGWETATGTPVLEAFGMSECSTFISAAPTRPAPPGTAGYAQAGRHVAVLDETGQPVPRQTPGVLAVHRTDPGLFLGYLGAAEETRQRFCGDWFLTGDTVRMEPDGAIAYLGRSDDMMNAGGFRVSPLEVEHVLNAHPQIGESAAVEVTVKQGANVIAAFYTGEAPVDEAQLHAYVAERLARYKQPRLYCHRTTLPRGANNKLLRRVLREEWEAEN